MKISKTVIVTSMLIFLALFALVVTRNKSRLNLTEGAQIEEAVIVRGEQTANDLTATSAGEARPELSEADKVLAATDEVGAETGVVDPTPTAIQTQPYTFFYGATCPHCLTVKEWFEENQVETKLNILKKEVYQNSNNSKQLTLAAQSCGIDPDRVGVPFLYTPDKKCIVGAPPIIEYLAERAGVAVE